jgi:hypothetical protein
LDSIVSLQFVYISVTEFANLLRILYGYVVAVLLGAAEAEDLNKICDKQLRPKIKNYTADGILFFSSSSLS